MIIGITGWFAAGKDTVGDYLADKGFKRFSLSDFIRTELEKEGKELTRDNMRDKGNELRDIFGPNYLAKRALEKIEKEAAGNWIIPSVRQPAEVSELRTNQSFVLLNVEAPSELRYARMTKRARTGEENISFEEFKEKEEKERGEGPNCQQVDKVIELADITLDNGGSFEDLYHRIDNFLEEYGNR